MDGIWILNKVEKEVEKVRSSNELTQLFFRDLKSYNSTNYKAILKADLTKQDATVHKAFSSVITRYFIFREKHPEVTETENKILYFKLKLDLISKYFSEYPDTTTDNLVAFQLELKSYDAEMKRREAKYECAAEIQDMPMASGS